MEESKNDSKMFALKRFESWKYPSILLLGIGLSSVGEWIYFIALNLMVLEMTGSPLAVSAFYIIKPFATMCTNFWAGSVIDRLNKRKLMVFLDMFRALFIALLPFFSSLILIYFIVFIINMASSIFVPTSMTYITKLIPQDQRKQFNSLHSLVSSGAFLIGPAVAGLLFLLGTPTFAIYINALALLVSGIVTLAMPDLERGEIVSSDTHFSWNVIKGDWKIVLDFVHSCRYVMVIYFLFTAVMLIMASAVDSLEVAFAKEVLQLSDSQYGFLVSIAGAGIIIGALLNSLFARKLETSLLIGIGALFVSMGYIIYAFSTIFLFAAIGFFVLAFFMAFANTGFQTFYQNNIPVEIMGRVGSVYNLIQAGIIIIVTFIMGLVAQITSVQWVVIVGSLIMMGFSILLCIYCFLPSKRYLYDESALTRNI